MNLHRYQALQRLWRSSPPLQAMVQAYLGIPFEDAHAVPANEDEETAVRRYAQAFAEFGLSLNVS